MRFDNIDKTIKLNFKLKKNYIFLPYPNVPTKSFRDIFYALHSRSMVQFLQNKKIQSLCFFIKMDFNLFEQLPNGFNLIKDMITKILTTLTSLMSGLKTTCNIDILECLFRYLRQKTKKTTIDNFTSTYYGKWTLSACYIYSLQVANVTTNSHFIVYTKWHLCTFTLW